MPRMTTEASDLPKAAKRPSYQRLATLNWKKVSVSAIWGQRAVRAGIVRRLASV